MISSDSQVRVRYGETDKMGYVYHGVYAQYFEIGRTEMLRDFGLTYKSFEDQGIMMPVHSLNVKFIKPAYYDDLLTIKTYLKKIPETRIEFNYEIYNEKNDLLTTGDITLVFINAKTRRPTKAPEEFLNAIKDYFC